MKRAANRFKDIHDDGGAPSAPAAPVPSPEPIYHLSPTPGGLAEKALQILGRTRPPRNYERENLLVLMARAERKKSSEKGSP
jgi:hypothetical protein